MSTNPFDEFQPAQPADPFDEFQRATPPVRTVLKAAATIKPDDMAEAERLAKRYPAPVDTLYRNLTDVRLQAAVDQANERLKTSPKLAEALARNPRLATMSHDDIEPLTRMEAFGNAIRRGFTRTLQGADVDNVVTSARLLDIIDRIERGELKTDAEIARATPYASMFAGAGRSPEALARMRQIASQRLSENAAEALVREKQVKGLPASRDFEEFQKSATFGEAAARIGGSPIRITSEVVAESLGALAPAIPLIVGAGLAGGPAALAGTVGLTSAGTEYVNALPGIFQKLGVDMNDIEAVRAAVRTPEFHEEARKAMTKAAVVGAFDAATAGVAGVSLSKSPIGNIVAQMGVQAAGGGAGEAVGSVAIGEEISPAAVLSEMIGEVPGAVIDVATVEARKVLDEAGKRTDALAASEQLEQALKDAGTSMLRERSPEQFRALMQTMTDGKVYVDGDVLNQLPPDVLATLPESVREQIPAAAAISASVEIPVADILTIAPGTPLEQVLVENARTDPTTMSKAEAEAASKQAGEYLQQEAERVIQQAQDVDAMRASQEAVKANVKQQILDTGRFRETVAEGYATWAAAFFTAYGSRMGMTPEQFYQRYPLRILGAAPAADGGQVMDQGGMTEDEYIARINPGGVRIPDSHRPVEYAADMEGMIGNVRTTPLGTHRVKGGLNIKIVIDSVGGVFALHKGKEVGYMAGGDRETQLAVAQEYQGKGIGALLSRYYRTRNPFALSGGLTEGGERAARSAFRYMRDNGLLEAPTLPPNAPAAGGAGELQQAGEPDRKFKLGDLPRDMREELFNEHAMNLNPDATERGFYAKSVPSGLLRLEGVQVADMRPTDWAYLDGAKLKDVPPVVIADGRLIDGQHRIQWARAQGYTSLRYIDVTGLIDTNAGGFISELPKGGALAQGRQPLGTFNPATLDLVLNPNANLSTFFHETGHFFLEVLADVASQPDAPAQIAEDFGTFLKWAGVKDAATWNAMTLDQKRPYHERWAESIEQYVMEGKAPSVELQPLMRRFAAWLKSVYGSIKRFLESRGQTTSGPVLGQAGVSEAQREAQADAVYSEIANDQEMIDALEVYMVSGDPPEGALNDKLLDYINRLPPVPADSYLTFYRNQPRGARPWARGWSSWTINEDQTRYFGGRDFEVLKRKGVHGLDLNRLGEYRTRATGEYSQYGSQGEWLVLNESVFNQDPAAQPGPPMALNDDIRRVMDRMLATDEQIQQANEVAGLLPDEDADALANERLRKRSIADLKWSVKARDEAIAKLRKEAAKIEKAIREQVTAEVDATPEMQAKRALDALRVSPEYAAQLAEHKAARKAAETAARAEVKAALLAANPEAKGLIKGQLLAKNKRDIENKVDAAMIRWDQANPTPKRPVSATDADVATIADSFGFESVDAMMQAIDAFGSRRDAIDGITERRMLEEHGDLIDERAIQAAANEAVHNEARARSLATELRTQAEMLGARTDTGEVNAKGSKITVNALVEAAKQFAANVVARTPLRDLKTKAWQHTGAERRASKRWTEATSAGKTEEAVKAKQDQMLNHAAAKAAIDAQKDAEKILDFFRRVTKGNDETVVEKGRDPDIVNAARAVLAAYGVETATTKRADEYLNTLKTNDPETYNVVAPMVAAATQNAQPLDALTYEELVGLHEQVEAMWHLAKRSRQMEVDGDLLDIDDVADQVYARLEEIGIPDEIPGERGALTRGELLARQWLQQAPALLRRAEQWAEAKDGKFGGPFLRFIFQPVKIAADKYRTERLVYREKFQALVDNIAPTFTGGTIDAPELRYTFGRGHNGIGHAELLHAILHTGNESNKRKLLLGRGWATENPDGTLDTSRWDAFLKRMHDTGVLEKAHYDFAQGVWDLMEETKPLAQKTHRDVFGYYFDEIAASPVETPFGTYRGGYVPAQADPALVQDADTRELLETENASMAFAFPQTNRGFTKGRVEYNRALKLDLRTLPQHIDKVVLFSYMEPAVRGVARLLRRPKVAQPLGRVEPSAMNGLLKPWLNRAARQTVETPISADAGLNRMASNVRARVGMALMFANVSNTLQQITGFVGAAVKVKPSNMRRALAQYIANPKKLKDSVWALSPYMADRASNEVAVLSDTLEAILINPTTFQRAEQFTRRHAYFLQTFFDNQMSPIIWTASYNQALAEGMDDRMAMRFADGVIRQTQGSTLPEDVSRIETGPAYARVFTQFVGYFNMLANTNATAIQQIAAEQGLKKGAGKAMGVLFLGVLAPIWMAEAIAHAMRGGPEDEDDDGYLDDWLAAVFGFGTIKGLLAGVPIIGQIAQSSVNRFNDQPADDKISLSPAVSVIESAVGAPNSVYKAIVDDASAQKAVRDASALITVMTGLPAMAAARPLGYLAGIADDRIEPTGPADMARGLISGTASPESKIQR